MFDSSPLRAATSVVDAAGLDERRHAHSYAAAARMADLLRDLDLNDRDGESAVAVALLHDVGYAHPDTGLHFVDGARLLRTLDFPERVVRQVAWHSTAQWEAGSAGFELAAEFAEPEDDLLRSLLWVADFTATQVHPDEPGGGYVTTISERVAGIRSRYAEGSPVITALNAGMPELGRRMASLGISAG